MDKYIVSKLCNIEKALEKIDKVAQILDTILLGREMNKAIDSKIEKHGQNTPQQHDGKTEVENDKIDQVLESNKQIQERIASLEQNIKYLRDTLHVKAEDPIANKDQHTNNEETIEILKGGNLNLGKEDWKRLKERLKEAMGYQRNALNEVHAQKTNTCMENLFGTWMLRTRVDWKEYVFGICTPDGRLGKEGSRSLPTSCVLVVFKKTY
jgi:predicted RNase H-like nuclease (RuvC/YqgF family)